MATISPRFDDQDVRIGWQVRIRKKGYPQQVKTFRTKSEAQAWAKSVETEMERGAWRDRTEAEATTLADALDRYREEVSSRKRTASKEASIIRQWQGRPLARVALARIRSKDIANAISDMERESKSANTIRLHLALLSHLFTTAATEWGMESLGNPVQVARKRKPKLPQGRDRRLQGDEEERLFRECAKAKNPWLLPVVRFAIETAMRAGEILETKGKTDEDGNRPIQTTGLLWKNVDLNRRVAFLPETKNGSARTVPLSSTAVEVLRGLSRSLDGKVFGTTYEAIHLSFARACKRAEIEDLRFHDLRHEATSRLFEKGLNPMEVSTITGHKTLQMLKRYTHLRAEDLAKRLG
ncbi:site-specific integrase [Acidithiobacillus sp. CV18-2]|nr:site-specific integrase [Acidithiobacillus sp. CV18-3]MBU2758071.1 site-specific integrase [Acidithiobacillus sp. BN09-2]MBU2777471.1 site-specific integrase [Acidithiobacillus sp. CV18-2]MBU2800557.1 site-specific integrase [Acidithiobacillus sp. VAN18-4]UTV82123.1 site-specific integrase [Acidithiobacillus sp. YTS05]